METKKMTIHRALAELKLIDSKIEKAINEIEPVGGRKKDGLVNDKFIVQDFENKAKSNFDKAQTLIKRKNIIKSAIMKSNSETIVEIANEKMSIADVIFYKELLLNKMQLLTKLKSEKANTLSKIESFNNKIEEKALTLAQSAMGNTNVKITDKDVLAITDPYIEKNKIQFVDPLKIDSKIEELQEEIDLFETEVDAILSESNAITIIGV